jgi:hypothetical protein
MVIFTLMLQPAIASDETLQQRVTDLEAQIESLADALDAAEESGNSGHSNVSLGGYGELHYNNLDAEDSSRDVDEIDFHRFVLFFGYEFTDRIRFVSEFELEHALAADGAGGEVELEQAYLEFDHNDRAITQTGVFLLPVGILNETHEPPTFYGVERNDVESIIIPSTWWEAGVQHIQRFGDGWQWNVAVHSGLAVPTDSFRIRSGRQKVSNADASNLAATTRLKYTGIAGLEVAASVQLQTDPSQQSGDGLDDGTLIEAHAIYSAGPFSIRALYASWDFGGDAVVAADADSQSGWYIEPSYKLNNNIGVYARASRIESARAQDNFDQTEIGLNWWPHPQVVFKVDLRDREHTLSAESGRDFQGFDLGMGYQF